MNVYLLSGLGADKRIFARLTFPEGVVVFHIEWITPLLHESLESYAARLSSQIDHFKPFMLIGVSFGGMVAVELTRILRPHKTIIISSASHQGQIPWYYRISGVLNLHLLVPVSILKAPTYLTFWFFGANTREQKDLLSNILKDTDGDFLRWAISKITKWKQSSKTENLFHIHGTSDRILPLTFIKPDLEIKNGGHLMVYEQHELISDVLAEQLRVP